MPVLSVGRKKKGGSGKKTDGEKWAGEKLARRKTRSVKNGWGKIGPEENQIGEKWVGKNRAGGKPDR
jgi:hypothetical protein